jgi:3-hydroxyacyl-CoA dehydrogenase
MGSGIASALLLAGLEVVLIERDDALSAGLGRIDAILEGSLKRGLLTDSQHAGMRARLSGATGHAALGAVDLVIECVFEDMAV